ncbi:DUF4287 domain-containing protein [Herbiconiux sp. VKM Ac-1786]|uniref:DUF4287 domain-containing protein n=1 Tax=Herbiconiux sp. VKM Ac-1786 TaxID=2783824 RepID=UPI00188A83C4|nr:DUF4287 domain-containing protein [Herbiconiux sp. VKM Ac-1786]MBF4571565.1 DUF4287 domain-containing protein [Herbiconiux sp. VKM Ac-1786]
MSFQAYLDTVEKKTGLTPRQLVALATDRGFGPDTKAGPILAWLADDYGLGRGHGMAMVHVITKGDRISSRHVGTGTAHSDPNDRLWLDGVATKPEGY